MNANPILLQKKYARIIYALAHEMDMSVRDAMDIFYRSYTYKEISQGISDMHCRSDAYLVQEIMDEYPN